MTALAELRGRTAVTDRAATRIVCRVARELPEVVELREGDGLPWTHTSGARVEHDLVGIRLFVTTAYPVPLRATAARIREQVAERVSALTGLQVAYVDVVITALRGAET
ncbi:Asp23/Gls24 family envelope stress response protein [Nonomuraea longicatena]|uniref:Asp23/Gls24 family envelope stress response protein n=1 Tax=Nonomuraea longicatena TaxID=83682 RepID=A0ABP3ZH20_9ACTN